MATMATMAKGKKSHSFWNTSTDISRLNTLVRDKIVFVELAGWMHDSLIAVRTDQVKPWMFHCIEGRIGKFTVPRPEDELLLKSSPIDPAWVKNAAMCVVQKFQNLLDVVTDGGTCEKARCVGLFEGLFRPKEGPMAPARAERDERVQKSINQNTFTAAAAVPDCLVRETMRMFAERHWEFTYYFEGEASAVAQFGVAHFALITSDDVDARFMLFYSNPAPTGYLIYPRSYYQQRQLKNPVNGLFWPKGSFLGVIASDADFKNGELIYPDGKKDGKGQGKGYDISCLIPYDRLAFLVLTGSDLVHARGNGAHKVLKFMFDTLALPRPDKHISPVDWIKKYSAFAGFDASTQIAHLEACLAYVLHPVPRIIDVDEKPFRFQIENLVRYHINEVVDGFPIRLLVDSGLTADSPLRSMLIEKPFPWNPPIMEYVFRNDHSCYDKNPHKEYSALILNADRADLPPLSKFTPVCTQANGVDSRAPRMDILVLVNYFHEIERKYEATEDIRGQYGSSYTRGHNRSIAHYTQQMLDQKKIEALKFFIDPSTKPLPNGPPCIMYVAMAVPRYKQQEQTRTCYLKLAFGLLYDAATGGEILQVVKILGKVCDEGCTLASADDCSHFVSFFFFNLFIYFLKK